MRLIWRFMALGLAATACHERSGPYVARARPALGAVFSVGAWGSDSARLARAVDAAVDSVRRVDWLFSLDRDSSELSRINRRAGRGAQPASGPVLRVLQEALTVASGSSGAFDPTGKDYRGVRVDTVRGTVHLRSGLKLDLGGIAPGYALDRALLALQGSADSAILGIGGVLLVVSGSPTGAGRHVGISDPDNSLSPHAWLELGPGAWAVGMAAATDVDPVPDPRAAPSGEPARSVTVVAQGGMLANAWSRAFFVLGCDSALVRAPRLGLGLICVDQLTRWTADLNGRVRLVTDSAAPVGIAPAPGREPVPAPAAAGRDSTTPRRSDSSR